MPRLGLALYIYTAPGNAAYPLVVAQYADALESLAFSTVCPGGYGELTCVLKVRDARVPRPELGLFSRVALMDTSNTPLFLGEVTDPALGLDEANGEYIALTALGAGNALRDDPITIAYTGSTVQQIARDQHTRRANYALPLDQDTAQIFPDNPAGTFAPAYTNRTMEEVIADLAFIASGAGNAPYDWFVYSHPVNKDAAGFPTARLSVVKRDTTTISYQASVAARDVLDYHIVPSAERAYNVVEIDVSDNAAGGLQTVTYTDPRLAVNGGQGSAPFRRRKYKRSLVGVSTVSKSTAQTIASSYGTQFQSATNKIEIRLKAVRDANGNPLPLQQVQAGRNIFIPDLTVRGQQLTSAPVPGVNLFYIVETRYASDAAGNQAFVIQCDNYYDNAGAQVARLQLAADSQQRLGQTTTGLIQALGAQLKGYWGVNEDNTTSGDAIGPVIDFGCTLSKTPTSVGFSASVSTGVSSGPFANTFSVYGCNAWVVSAGGVAGWIGTFTTNGNCLRAVDLTAGTFDWHCDGCDALHTGLSLADDLQVAPATLAAPGTTRAASVGLAVRCPGCGHVEAFNPELSAADEQDAGNVYPHRAAQSRLIRAVMAAPQTGLATSLRP